MSIENVPLSLHSLFGLGPCSASPEELCLRFIPRLSCVPDRVIELCLRFTPTKAVLWRFLGALAPTEAGEP